MTESTVTTSERDFESGLTGERLAICSDAACEIESLSDVLASTEITSESGYLVRGLALRIHELNRVILSTFFDPQGNEIDEMRRAVFGLRGSQT